MPPLPPVVISLSLWLSQLEARTHSTTVIATEPRATASQPAGRRAIAATPAHPPTLSVSCADCAAPILYHPPHHAGLSGSFDAGAQRAQQFESVAVDAATAARSQTDAVGHFACDSGGKRAIDGICGRITRSCSKLTRSNSGARCVAQRKWGSGRFSLIRLIQRRRRLFQLASSPARRCKPPAAAATTATTTGRDESSAITFRQGGHSLSVRTGSQRQQFATAFFVRCRRCCCCCGIQFIRLEWQKRQAPSGAD